MATDRVISQPTSTRLTTPVATTNPVVAVTVSGRRNATSSATRERPWTASADGQLVRTRCSNLTLFSR